MLPGMTSPLLGHKITYADLNPRQKENYNYSKLSAVLADYGFTTMRLSDDFEGADFIAQHIGGETILKVQLKGRFTVARKYQGKDLYVAFGDGNNWYVYPHDLLLEQLLAHTNIGETRSWTEGGAYSYPGLTAQLREWLAPYQLEVTLPLSADTPDGSA